MEKNKLIFVRVFLLALIILWCSIIFIMSGETADISSDRSGGISEKIINAFASFFGYDGEGKLILIDKFETVLRKMAHAFSYFVLSSLTLCFFNTFNKINILEKGFYSFSFALVYALSDEIHQIFVEGIAGMLSDVLIDMIGASVGILLVFLIFYLINRKKEKNKALQ